MKDETRTVRTAHKGHVLVVQTTDHIRNVPVLETHSLVSCECGGFYGWVPKENV